MAGIKFGLGIKLSYRGLTVLLKFVEVIDTSSKPTATLTSVIMRIHVNKAIRVNMVSGTLKFIDAGLGG